MKLTPPLRNLIQTARQMCSDLARRAWKVAVAIVKAPCTLLCLPRRYTLTLWRALLVLVALGIVYSGVEEAKLRWRCPRPLEISASSLAETSESPIWARVSGLAPPLEVAVEASEGGNFKGIWLPLVSPDNPGVIAAVLRAPNRGTATALQSGKLVTVEGLACFPKPNEAKNLEVYLHWLGKPVVTNLHIVDLQTRPAGLFGIVLYFVAGLGVFALAFARSMALVLQGEVIEAEEGLEEPMTLVFEEYQGQPLAEEAKMEVQLMLDHAWTQVEKQA